MLKSTHIKIVAIILVSVLASATAVVAQEKFRETYEMFAVAMGTSNPPIIPPGTNMTLQINITRWTTDEEREALFAELIENGQQGLYQALQKQEETGWARSRGTSAMRTFPREVIRYARQFDLGEGKRRIVLALDRPISFWEAVNQPRWRDYDITLVVMDVDAKGEGEGQLAMGVRLQLNMETKQLVIENFGSEPVRLNRIRKR